MAILSTNALFYVHNKMAISECAQRVVDSKVKMKYLYTMKRVSGRVKKRMNRK